MRLKSIHLSNFRCYREPISIDFGNITTLIGKNDFDRFNGDNPLPRNIE